MALHEQAVGAFNGWRTPRVPVFEKLGCVFDTDVASCGAETSQVPAKRHITRNALSISWASLGFVWMNAPFNKGKRNGLVPWLTKLFEHGNGIGLTPDRTSCPWWREFATRADLVLFVSPKIKFLDADGTPGACPAQGSSLFAVGERGSEALMRGAEHGLGTLMRPVPLRRLEGAS
jgi:hypothetical protein